MRGHSCAALFCVYAWRVRSREWVIRCTCVARRSIEAYEFQCSYSIRPLCSPGFVESRWAQYYPELAPPAGACAAGHLDDMVSYYTRVNGTGCELPVAFTSVGWSCAGLQPASVTYSSSFTASRSASSTVSVTPGLTPTATPVYAVTATSTPPLRPSPTSSPSPCPALGQTCSSDSEAASTCIGAGSGTPNYVPAFCNFTAQINGGPGFESKPIFSGLCIPAIAATAARAVYGSACGTGSMWSSSPGPFTCNSDGWVFERHVFVVKCIIDASQRSNSSAAMGLIANSSVPTTAGCLPRVRTTIPALATLVQATSTAAASGDLEAHRSSE